MFIEHRDHVKDGDGVVHVVNYQTVGGQWLLMCSRSCWLEDSDYVDCMPNMWRTVSRATCLLCIANEDRWTEDGRRKPGREWE